MVGGEFNDRCRSEVSALVAAGATVSFVSHDLGRVAGLCDRVMWLEDGEVREIGDAQEVVERYSRHVIEHAGA